MEDVELGEASCGGIGEADKARPESSTASLNGRQVQGDKKRPRFLQIIENTSINTQSYTLLGLFHEERTSGFSPAYILPESKRVHRARVESKTGLASYCQALK